MNSRTLRLLIREMLLKEESTPAAATVQPGAGTALKTKTISPYHVRRFPGVHALKDAYAVNLKAVGGVVKTYSNGKLIGSSADTALSSVADINQATAKMETMLRNAIKNNALIYRDPQTWRANWLAKRAWVDGKPYLASDESARHLEAYEKAEIDTLPIMFIIASPDAPRSSREQAFAECCGGQEDVSRVYAYYDPAGVYVVNLVTDQGLRTLKPVVLSNKTDGPVSQASKDKILSSFKSAFSNPVPDGFVAAHEFGHAESAFLAHFFNVLATSRRPESKFSTWPGIADTLNDARLTDLKAAVLSNASDLISAEDESEIFSAVLRHDPSLIQGSTSTMMVHAIERIFEYATILRSLDIYDAPITKIFPVTDAQPISPMSPKDGRTSFAVGPITMRAPSVEDIVQWSNEQNLDAFTPEHITITLKMLQQHSQTLGDVGLAIQNLSKGSTSPEEARRAKIILQLAGESGLGHAVMKFAANDTIQKSPRVVSQPATSAKA